MEIIFHAHHANISDRMRKRAEASVRRIAARLTRAVDAIIRFEQDGRVKRVEIVLHAPRQRKLIARGEAGYYGPALSTAIDRLTNQIRTLRAERRRAERARDVGKVASA
ncbi:MAG: HPF/RaiA family ribosome-associated protein [Gemmatimonadaceae bacterium]